MDGVFASTVSDLEISIGDINDNGPEFYECESEPCTQKNSFTGKVDEHSSAGLAVNDLNIRVKDPDQVRSYNTWMVYSDKILCCGFFSFIEMMTVMLVYLLMFNLFMIQGQNSRFILELAGPDKDAFQVIPSSGLGDSVVQVTIKDPNAVDYEKKTVMYVQVCI